MAQSETQEQNKPTTKSNLTKNNSANKLLIVAFVVLGTLLALTEISGNVMNDLESRSANSINASQTWPTATPTLTPEELQKILQENSQLN